MGEATVGLTLEECSVTMFCSLAVCAIALYSTSALDQATTFCFLFLHATRFLPRNMQYPVVDLLSRVILPNLHERSLPP